MENWIILLGVFVIVDLFLLTVVVVKRSRSGFGDDERRKYGKVWEKILKLDGRHAVLEADNLLYEVLEKVGYKGSLGDKLKKAGPAFTDVNAVWRAHKLRNRIAHELGFDVRPEQAKEALKNFRRAYRDIGLKI